MVNDKNGIGVFEFVCYAHRGPFAFFEPTAVYLLNWWYALIQW